jgi:hypothetical protein
MRKYVVQVWIPVEEEEQEAYSSEEEALRAIESLSLMQPENIYEVLVVESDDNEGEYVYH